MAFNVIDGFNVNAAVPVDYRLVVGTTASRDALQYKYNGLSVFVESDRKTYIWNSTSLDWDMSFSGIADRMAVMNPNGNGITASIIQNGLDGIILLNTNSYITTLGTMSIIGGTGYGVKGGNVVITGGYGYSASGGDLYINSGSNTGNLYLGYDSNYGNITGNIGIGTNVVDAGVDLQINPIAAFNSLVRLKALSEANSGIVFNSTIPYSGVTSSAYIKSNSVYSGVNSPDYTWYGNTRTGIYHPAANNFGISLNAVASALYTPTNIGFAVNGATSLSIGPTATSIIIAGAPVSILSMVPEKVRFTVNDIYANVHNIGGGVGIGDSGNIPYLPNGGGTGTGPWQYPSIASGSAYTPVSADILNVSSLIMQPCLWIRVGNIVNVTGQLKLSIGPSASITSGFSLTLPIKSYFSTHYWQLNGVGKVVTSTTGENAGGGDTIAIYACGGIS